MSCPSTTTGFTTWCNLYAALLDRMAQGDLTVGEVGQGDKRVRWRTFDEFERLLSWVESRCQEERGIRTRRTYAGQGGRG